MEQGMKRKGWMVWNGLVSREQEAEEDLQEKMPWRLFAANLIQTPSSMDDGLYKRAYTKDIETSHG